MDTGFNIINEKSKTEYGRLEIFLLTLITVGGMGFLMQELFEDKKSYLVLLIIVFATSFLAVMFGMIQKKNILIVALVFISFLFILGLLNTYITSGLSSFVNQIIAQYNYINGFNNKYFVVKSNNNELSYYLFLVYILLFLSIYVEELIKRKQTVILSLMWLPLLLISFILKLNVGFLVIVPACISVICVFSYSQMKIEKNTVFLVTLIILIVLLMFSSYYYYKNAVFHPSMRIEAMKESTKKRIDTIRYGKSDYPEGDLKNKINTTTKKRMTVTIKGGDSNNRVYLKGFTGSNYKDEVWKETENSIYSNKYEGMTENYMKNAYHPLASLSCYIHASINMDDAALKSSRLKITVKNEKAYKKYIYIPDSITYKSLIKLNGIRQDTNVLSAGNNLDTYTFETDNVIQDGMLSYNMMGWVDDYYKNNKSDSSFVKVEEDYRKFVHKYYLDIPNNQRKKDNEKIKADNTSLALLTKDIRMTLNNMGKEHKDYSSANYASIGALMYRAKGIPSRYVEGYLVVGKGEIVVSAADCHAWVEVYKDGVGWIAVDVTPGYYATIPEQGNVKKVKNQNVVRQKNSMHDKNGKTEENSGYDKFKWLKILITIIIVLIILILIIFIAMHIRWMLIMKRRKKELTNSDRVLVLKFLSSYLYSIRKGFNLSEEVFIKDKLSDSVKAVFNRLWFGTENDKHFSDKDISEVKSDIIRLQNEVWIDTSIKDKFILKYIKYITFPIA